jgi:hypothetical protein
VAFGKSQPEARRWVTETDEPNARQIASTNHLADLHVHMAELEDDER